VKLENLQLSKEIWRSGFWAPLTVFLAHVILSLTFNAYERVPVVDIPIHFLGGMAIAFFCSRTLDILGDYAIVDRVDDLLRAVLLITLTATAAVFWEFAEYVSDRVFGTRAQEGLEDTLFDMLLGILGGFTLVSFLWMKHGRGNTLHK
jgi:hypothetical protein